VITKLNQGLDLLGETATTCIQMSEAGQNEKPCADTTIQLKLGTGVSVLGGFGRFETLEEVLRYARCFYRTDVKDSVVLRFPHKAGEISETERHLTLEELGLSPRAILLASTQSDEKRRDTLQEKQVAVKSEMRLTQVNIQKTREEKLKKQEDCKIQRESILRAFKDDRTDQNARQGGGSS